MGGVCFCFLSLSSLLLAHAQFPQTGGQNQQGTFGTGTFGQSQQGINSGTSSGGNLDFLTGLTGSSSGQSGAQGVRFQMSSKGFSGIDWMKVDRRAEEGKVRVYD